jgi:hypothetical protein
MTNQALDLKNYDLDCLGSLDCINVNGGTTDIAYDLGTLLRYSYYCVSNNFTGQVLTICQWAKKNGYK